MSRKMKLWLAFLGVLLLTGAFIFLPSFVARTRARRDVAHGYYHITEYGDPAGDFRVYQGLLLRRYGVHVTAGGCIVPSDIKQVDAYNDVVCDSLIRKYHHDIFAEAASASLSSHSQNAQ